MLKLTRNILALLFVLLCFPALAWILDERAPSNWRTAQRDVVDLTPPAMDHSAAIVQVYAARAFKWRGAFAVHTWVSIKGVGETDYRSYHVMGWRRGSKVVSMTGRPDRQWYGAAPDLLVDIRGPEAETLIPKIEEAIETYPYRNTYKVWPGPNSNTFVAWIGRQVEGLRLDLPSTAVGKDYIAHGVPIDWAISGTGVRMQFYGLLGATVALEEGIEANILGLHVGIDPMDLSLRLPGFGHVGP